MTALVARRIAVGFLLCFVAGGAILAPPAAQTCTAAPPSTSTGIAELVSAPAATSPAATSPAETLTAPAYGFVPSSPFSTPAAPAAALPMEDVLAAESLLYGARSLVYSNRQPGQAARLTALANMSWRLNSDDPEAMLLMVDLYQSQQKDKLTAQTLQRLLTSYPNSHVLGLRWLQAGMKCLESAAARTTLLQGVIDDKNAPDPLRAEASYRLASIAYGQGQKSEGMAAIYAALQMDPWHASSLEEKYRGLTSPTPADRATMLLGLLRGNPRNVDAAWEMGSLAGAMGMYDQSVGFYSYGVMLTEVKGADDPRKAQQLCAGYYNALLDKLQTTRDVESVKKLADIVEQASKAYPLNMDLQSLLVETCQASGQKERAAKVIEAMKANYDNQLKKSPTLTSDFAGELAWFYILMQPDAALALKYAQAAAEIKDKSPTINRILGIAELMSDNDELRMLGERRLKRVLQMESFASVFLAEYYDGKGDVENRDYAVQTCSLVSRSGPAFRRLQELIYKVDQRDKKTIKLPDIRGIKEFTAAMDGFDTRCLQAMANADKFVSVTIKPIRDKVLPGEPIELEAVLTNIGSVPLSLGDAGLFNPVMELVVQASSDPKQPFYNVPMVTWQAPRYMATGQTVRTRFRLDIGPLADHINARPLEDITIVVHGLVNAEIRDQRYVSAVPSLKVEPATVTRLNLLTMADKFDASSASSWPAAYKQVLGTIAQRHILRGELPERILAAGQVGCLYSTARNAELNAVKLPSQVASEVSKPVIQAMLQALMKDKSPAVRAQAVASVPNIVLDQTTINLISMLMDDPSPVVRLRVLDKLGGIELKGQTRLIMKYGADSDEIIKTLAAALSIK